MATYVTAIKSVPSWLQAIPFALGVTLALLLMMEHLIFTEYPDAPTEDTVIIPEVHWEEPKLTEVIERKVDKPVEPEKEPPAPPRLETLRKNPTITLPKVAINKEVPVKGNAFGYRMPVPQVMVSPKYPMRALNSGVEGYVDVRFDITERGLTENVSVIGSNPEGVFETAAVEAVNRWRYLPQLDDGKAIPFLGMTQRLRFEIQ